MAASRTHLPPPHAFHTVRERFQPYAGVHDATLAPLLDRVVVHGVSGIEYHCTPVWRIPPRRITDEMFLLVLTGGVRMTVDGRRFPLRPGDCAHWQRGCLHEAAPDTGTSVTVIAVHYTATLPGGVLLGDLMPLPPRLRSGRSHPLPAVLQECARLYTLQPLGWRPSFDAAITTVLMDLLRRHAPDPAAHVPRLQALARIQPALAAMRERLDAPIAIPVLARRCALSPAQFRRVFHHACGCPPVVHLRRLRIAAACVLLRDSTASIDTIARRVGYSETAFFARTFRTLLGQPPGRWRVAATI